MGSSAQSKAATIQLHPQCHSKDFARGLPFLSPMLQVVGVHHAGLSVGDKGKRVTGISWRGQKIGVGQP